ncbi:MAG: AAC(3) family N-acetyltransferase [Clostridiaceae bacterium]|nr:AAC(3) family N-acetyltransferase [Clostridiaceae bacterium]
MAVVNEEQIRFSLQLLGIGPADTIIAHGALSSIGYVEGGAKTVIRLLLELIGPEGTLVMPTLTGWSEPFDVDQSPSAVGILSETLRTWPGAFRSKHPVHSVAAVGAQAEYITAGHEDCKSGCGRGTPYEKIISLKGKILLIGVDMARNTMMHTIEAFAELKNLLRVEAPAPTYIDDYENKKVIMEQFPPGHRNFMRITPELKARGALQEGKIGAAVTKVIDAVALIEIGLEKLEENPLYFTCDSDSCITCEYARQLQKDAVDLSLFSDRGCGDLNCEICVPMLSVK